MKKTSDTARTQIADIAIVGPELTADQLGAVVGGMICREGSQPVSTRTLTENGGSDTQQDCG